MRDRIAAACAPLAPPAAWWGALRAPGSVGVLSCREPGWAAGVAAVDAAVDAGAGALLLLSEIRPGSHARAVTALYCGLDAAAVTATGATDLDWMRACAEIRDAIPVLRPLAANPHALLDGDPDLAWLTACLLQAAVRRTPIVVAGALAVIAALCAERVSDAAGSWIQCGIGDDDVAAQAAMRRLDRQPWMSTSLPADHAMRTALLTAATSALDDRRPDVVSG